jgi:hypothetical protein
LPEKNSINGKGVNRFDATSAGSVIVNDMQVESLVLNKLYVNI